MRTSGRVVGRDRRRVALSDATGRRGRRHYRTACAAHGDTQPAGENADVPSVEPSNSIPDSPGATATAEPPPSSRGAASASPSAANAQPANWRVERSLVGLEPVTSPAAEPAAEVIATLGSVPLPAWARLGAWLNRPRRVLLTLAAVWVISVFDLGFTVGQWGMMEFQELNPLAARLLDGPVHGIAAFKFGFLTSGTIILLALRRHSVAELACWFLLATKVYIAIRWFAYFDCVVHGRSNPLVEV